MTFTTPLVVTVSEAAEILRMSEPWVEREIAAGRLPSVKYGRARRIRMSDLEQFVAERNDAQPKRVVSMKRRRRPQGRPYVRADAPPGGWPLPEFAPPQPTARERGARG